jgi:carbon-monoxide dehydrogenase large subunit
MPYAVGTFASRAAVMSGSAIHLASLPGRRARRRSGSPPTPWRPASTDLQIVDGVVSVKGSPGSSLDLGTVAVLSNPLRYAFDEASKAATQFTVGDPGKPPVPEDDEPGTGGHATSTAPERSTFASGMHAVIVETDPDTAEITILKYAVVHDCGYG